MYYLALWRSRLISAFCLSIAFNALLSPASSFLGSRDRGYDTPGTHDVDAHGNDIEFQHYVTRPDIVSHRWDITVYNGDALAPGYYFVAPYSEVRQEMKGGQWVGPMIYTHTGDLVWSGAPMFKGWDCFGFARREGIPIGKDGKRAAGLSLIWKHEAGIFLDNTYTIRKKSYIGGLGDPFQLNMHELNVVDNGKKLLQMTSKEVKTSREISADIGYDGRCEVHFQGFEERDIETLETTFKWDSEGIIPLSETFLTVTPVKYRCENTYDYLHCNSLDKFPDGHYLVGCRHTDTVYKISHHDGSIIWRFGGTNGTRSDFQWINSRATSFGSLANSHFSGQHDVKIWDADDTHILLGMLDNASRLGRQAVSNDFARGLLISLDLEAMTAEIFSEYPHPQEELVHGRGSFQLLPNGNAFVGFTEHSAIAEYDRDGTLLMEAKIRPNMKTYRAYKFPWVGNPILPPDVYSVVFVDDLSKYQTSIYISWNGATEVVKWNIYHAHANGSTSFLTSTPKTGFETAFNYNSYVSHIIVAGLDSTGEELGRSKMPTKTVGEAATIAGLDAKEVEWIAQNPPTVVTFFEQPIVAFISGMVVCAGMGVAGLIAWLCTRSSWKQTAVNGSIWKRKDGGGREHGHLLKPWNGNKHSGIDEDDEDAQEDVIVLSEDEDNNWDEESKQRVR